MRDRQARVELEGAAEGLLGLRVAAWRGLDVLPDHAVAATEAGPRGSEGRIQLQAAPIEIARRREPVVGAGQLVRPEVELVGAGVARRVERGRGLDAREREREGLHDAVGDVVLKPEQVAQRRLHRLRREQRPARGLDQLRRGS